MQDSIHIKDTQVCFQLKTGVSPCTVLHLIRYTPELFAEQLVDTINKAPNFFIGAPIVLDLEMIQNLSAIDLLQIKQSLATHGMILVGVRGGSSEQHTLAATAGIPTIVVSKSVLNEPTKRKSTTEIPLTKLMTQPIRSGMQVYAKETDLIIINSVSVGAEIMAEGNIHVYGPLRGRALAGVQGNIKSRIFCQSLEAELVSVAGYYLMKDDIQKLCQPNTAVQVFLENEHLQIKPI